MNSYNTVLNNAKLINSVASRVAYSRVKVPYCIVAPTISISRKHRNSNFGSNGNLIRRNSVLDEKNFDRERESKVFSLIFQKRSRS